MKKDSRLRKKVLLVGCFLLVLYVSVFPTTSFSLASSNHLSSEQIPSSRQKIQSEESPIDSFDVNPKSGRWTVTETNDPIDVIVDGQLSINTSAGSGTSEYFATRGLQKTDSKIEYRYKANLVNWDNPNYAYRQKITVGAISGASTNYQVNLTLSNATSTSSGSTVYLNGNSYNNFNDIRFYDLHGYSLDYWFNRGNNLTWIEVLDDLSSEQSFYMYYGFSGASSGASGKNTFEQIDSYHYFDDFETGTINTTLWDTNQGSPAISTDSFEGTYAIDFNTTALTQENIGTTALSGDLSNTAVTTYFYDTLQDNVDAVLNIDGGTTALMGLYETTSTTHYVYRWDTTFHASSVARSAGWHELTFILDDVNNLVNFYIDDTLIDSESYASISAMTGVKLGNFWTSKMYSNTSMDAFYIRKFYDFPSYTFTSEETQSAVSVTANNFVLGFWDQDNSQPLANITQSFDNDTAFRYKIELYDDNLNTVSYYYSDYQLSSDTGYAAVNSNLFVDGFTNVTDQWQETGASPYLDAVDTTNYISNNTDNSLIRWFTFADTSSNHASDYTTQLGFYILDSDNDDDLEWKIDTTGDNVAEFQGTLSNPVGGWNVISLSGLDTKTEINAARVSITYKSSGTANNIAIDAVKLVITHDSTINSASCYNAYCRVTIDYNILLSEFTIEVKSDSGTRLFKVDWTDDFTNTGKQPELFAHEKSPDIYFSTYTEPNATLQVWLDYINAPFKERTWTQTASNGDSQIYADNYNILAGEKTVTGGSSTWLLSTPYLDAVTGTLKIISGVNGNFSNMGASDRFAIEFRIYAIDWDDGDSHSVFDAYMNLEGNSPFTRDVSVNSVTIRSDSSSPSDNMGNPTLAFNVKFSDDRSKVSIDTVTALDGNGSDYKKYSITKDMSDISSDASQEFLIRVDYYMALAGDMDIQIQLTDFDFATRDILAGLGNLLGDIVGGLEDAANIGGNILGDLARLIVSPLTTAFGTFIKWLGGIIGGIINGLQTALQLALSSLGTLLEAAINALQPFLDAINNGINGLVDWLSDIVDAVVDLATGIIDYLISVASDILDAFLALMNDIIDAMIGVASYLLDALLDLMPFGIGAIVRSFNNLSITDVVNTIVDAFNFLLNLWLFTTFMLLIFLGLYMTVPLLKATDPDKVGDAFGGLLHNAFNLHGFDLNTGLGNLTIPIRINAFALWLILAVLGGYLALIFPITLF